MARARRGRGCRRDSPLCRFLGRTPAGLRRGPQPRAPCVTCNGRGLPSPPPIAPANMSPVSVSRHGRCRLRCSRPSNSQAPLTFDVYDTWNGRSLGGCVYHVAHPGGPQLRDLPVNSYEAAARRLIRFESMGHTPGPYTIPPEERSLEYPMTLDLRRPTSGLMKPWLTSKAPPKIPAAQRQSSQDTSLGPTTSTR